MSASSIKDHPVQGMISRIVELQSSPEFAEPAVVENEQYVFARDKAFAMAHVVHSLLENTPPELISAPGLSNLNNNLQAPLGELNAFIANKNPQHIVNAASQFEQNILPMAWTFGPQLQTLTPDSLSKLFEAQANASREAIGQLTRQRDALAKNLDMLTARTAEQTTAFNTLTEGAARERAEAVAAVAKLDQQFAEKETERASKIEETIIGLRDNFKMLQNSANTDAAALVKKLEKHQSDAARIVQVVGSTGITGNYQKIANSEGREADLWRWFTIVFFGAGLAVAGATFYKFWHQPFSAENAWSVVIRLLYAIAITAPAWYTARESARHRTTSDRARQTELELASLGPFIELMPEEKKVQIRESLTTLYFGKSVDAHTANNPFDASAVKDMAVELVKLLKKG